MQLPRTNGNRDQPGDMSLLGCNQFRASTAQIQYSHFWWYIWSIGCAVEGQDRLDSSTNKVYLEPCLLLHLLQEFTAIVSLAQSFRCHYQDFIGTMLLC